ncbi:hypothetical protein [Chelativorans sp. YIM 93263]|uniref:hypothetical protein n=1 Tax=Chelativorans sp. YIM 93263 TaxID=2906648 RepID=UPI0023798FA0|nr:hypothetical protein [Chelativorans sp. YIM 93263]
MAANAVDDGDVHDIDDAAASMEAPQVLVPYGGGGDACDADGACGGARDDA